MPVDGSMSDVNATPSGCGNSLRQTFPRHPDELTLEWLAESLAAHIGAATRLSGFATTILGEGAGMAGIVVRVDLAYDGDAGGAPRSVCAKFSTSNPANRALMASLGLYRRETVFYRMLAEGNSARKPVALRTDISEDGGACVLLLEDFPFHVPGDQVVGCSIGAAVHVVREAARLHASLWGSERPSGLETFAGPFSEGIARSADMAWPRLIASFPDLVGPHIAELREPFGSAMARYARWTNEGPATVTHGDFRLDNMLFGPIDGRDPVVLIDWQAVCWAKGIKDLTYFLTQSLTVEDRRSHELELLDEYRSALASHGVEYLRDECLSDYRKAAVGAFAVAVAIAAGLEATNERAMRLMRAALSRAVAAFDDLDLRQVVLEQA